MKRHPNWLTVCLIAVIAFLAGLAVQWMAFEKELWMWSIRRDQEAIRIRIERLEAEDLESLIDSLKEYGQEIERAMVILGMDRTEEGGEDGD